MAGDLVELIFVTALAVFTFEPYATVCKDAVCFSLALVNSKKK
jgi:hypothetical protein